VSNLPKLGVGLSYHLVVKESVTIFSLNGGHHKSRNIASLKEDAGYTSLIGVMP
jgi:hypothetical protein